MKEILNYEDLRESEGPDCLDSFIDKIKRRKDFDKNHHVVDKDKQRGIRKKNLRAKS